MSSGKGNAILRGLRGIAAAEANRNQSDGELLRRFLNDRDQGAFTALLRRHEGMVMAICRRWLPASDAEDAFQATFLALSKAGPSLSGSEVLGGWLHQVAYRVCMKAQRSAVRRKTREQSATPVRQAPAADEEVSLREAGRLLDEEVARLPETLRTVFVLCCFQERSRAEVARQLGVQEGTVWRRLSQARQRLRDRLGRRGIDLTALLALAAVAGGEAALRSGARRLRRRNESWPEKHWRGWLQSGSPIT
jgi:RNA polymerase sigma factor (sigma-70 family)